MNDVTNDGTGATEGILADLADLQESVAAGNRTPERDVESIKVQLDTIAAAAQSLREPEISEGDESGEPSEGAEDLGLAQESEPAKERPARKSARSAVANRGLVFEQFVRDTAEEEPKDTDSAEENGEEEEDEQDAPQASATFDPRNPFAAAPPSAPVARSAPALPKHGGLIFQVPKAELAEVVEVDEVDDEPYDDYQDAEDLEPAESTEAAPESSSDSEQNSSEDSESGNRRRRRGGRGRRSRGRDENSAEDEESGDRQDGAAKDRQDSASKNNDTKAQQSSKDDEKQSDKSSDKSNDDTDDSDDSDDESGSRRRRRRRARTRGGDNDEVTSLKGSTRLEAKRQRRKEGREAGRRRPVITEAEFLARRESVERTMLVRESGNQTQLVVLEDGIAVEHYLKENRQQSSLIGNVYLGKVQNVLPSMEAAFIDIGKGRNAVLYAGEVNWDALGMDGKARRIELALNPGDAVLVQVTKDPIGHKGARLTSQISLPGRFLVYVPGNSMTGISRKLPDVERSRLKKLLKELVGDSAGVIVRTAAEGATDKELSRDVERLAKRWDTISKKSTSTKVLAPHLLYSEPDMIVRIIRDVFNEDFSSLVIDGDGAWNTIHEYVESVAPDLLERVHSYSEDVDIFEHYRVEEQIQKALTRTVNLPSGGSLVIDRTEAMTVVDVNTGKFTGSGGNLEETVTRNNLEAAEEVIRQLRLRDIGGIIVVDFIDMVLESNRDLVLRRLVECLGRDRTKHQVAEVTSLGLVQMTRKRIGTGLAESMVTAGHDLSGQGLLLPGSEEDGSKAFHHNSSSGSGNSNSGSGGSGKRDRKRRNDNKPAAKKQESENQNEAVTNDVSRSAVAAIAKATLKKDEAENAEPEKSETTETVAAAPAEELKAAPVEKPTPVEVPAADLPLMIGAETTTKVAVAEPVKKPRRRKPAAKAKTEAVQETLPTSFVIIGES